MLGRSTSLGMDSRSKASYHFALCRRQNGGLLHHHPWDQKSKQIFCKFLGHSVSPQEPTQPPHPTSRLDNSVRSRSRHLLLAVRSLRSSWASLLNARLLLSLPCLAHPQPVSTSTPINLESGAAGLAIFPPVAGASCYSPALHDFIPGLPCPGTWLLVCAPPAKPLLTSPSTSSLLSDQALSTLTMRHKPSCPAGKQAA